MFIGIGHLSHLLGLGRVTARRGASSPSVTTVPTGVELASGRRPWASGLGRPGHAPGGAEAGTTPNKKLQNQFLGLLQTHRVGQSCATVLVGRCDGCPAEGTSLDFSLELGELLLRSGSRWPKLALGTAWKQLFLCQGTPGAVSGGSCKLHSLGKDVEAPSTLF